MRPLGTAGELERRRRRAVELLEAGHGLTVVARMLDAAKSAVWQWQKTVRRAGGRDWDRSRLRGGRPS